jgi:hypothetical protein
MASGSHSSFYVELTQLMALPSISQRKEGKTVLYQIPSHTCPLFYRPNVARGEISKLLFQELSQWHSQSLLSFYSVSPPALSCSEIQSSRLWWYHWNLNSVRGFELRDLNGERRIKNSWEWRSSSVVDTNLVYTGPGFQPLHPTPNKPL